MQKHERICIIIIRNASFFRKDHEGTLLISARRVSCKGNRIYKALIIRVHGKYKKHLKPLCQGKGRIHPLPACPSKEDVIRRYEVVAVQKKLIYNRYGDHDPNGLVFVPLEDVDNVLAGKCMPEPLILRANVGDWI